MNKIYRGESLNFVFKCKNSCGRPFDMTGKQVSALLRDCFGEVFFRFSTEGGDGIIPVKVKQDTLLMRLSDKDTVLLEEGKYILEVKVRDNDLVMIDIERGIKVYDSIISNDNLL